MAVESRAGDVRAVVTGAASGLGAALVAELIGRGAKVVGVDLPGDERASALASLGAAFVGCDVSDQGAWTAVVNEVRRTLGSVNVVALNAGIMTRGRHDPIDDDPLGHAGGAPYRRLFAVNVDGVVFGLAALRDVLAPPATVMLTASTAGLGGLAFDPFYAMTKHAIVGLARSLASPFAERGIRLHAVCPGGMDTAIVPDAVRSSSAFRLRPAEDMARAMIDLAGGDEDGGVWLLGEDRALVRYAVPPTSTRS